MNRIYVCGSGGAGILLTGNLEDTSSAVLISIPYALKSISLGGELAVAITEDHTAIYWKMNLIHEILPHITVIKVAAGWSHALVMSESSVWAIGRGVQGQLGLGDTIEVNQPTAISIDRPLDITCGFRTSFVVVQDGLFCFGENTKFQLGLQPKTSRKTPEKSPFFNSALSLISSGNKHTAAYYQNTLYTWGNNTYGQLGLSIPESSTPSIVPLSHLRIEQLSCGWHSTAFITSSSELYITGRGDMGQQANQTHSHAFEFHKILEEVSSISSGSEHLIAIQHHKAYVWGWNEHGNLALGHTSNISSPTEVPLNDVQQVFAGAAYSYFICNSDNM